MIYSSLEEKEHRFQVRAIDRTGNVETTPAEHHWTVDTTPPATVIEMASAPPAQNRLDSASFSFSSEPGATFSCSLDGDSFTDCSAPQAYSALADGPHTFQVKAVDMAGNAEPTPSTYSWEVDRGRISEPPMISRSYVELMRDSTHEFRPPRNRSASILASGRQKCRARTPQARGHGP
jgi:hypothetical protein